MKYPITQTINCTLASVLLSANIFLLFGLPLLLQHSLIWALLLIPVIIFSNTYWSLIHEGIHFLFHSNRKVNEACCRILSIFFGCSFNVLRLGHLTHHRHNRSDHDRPEVFEKNKHKWFSKTLHYYWFLTNGLYTVEIFLPFLCFLPQKTLFSILNNSKESAASAEIISHFQKQLSQSKMLRKIRIDTFCVILIYSLSFYLFGMYFWVLLIVLFSRGFLISVADNLPHYGTPINNKYYAYNLQTPSWFEFILLNFNYHRIHHQSPNIPWHALPNEYLRKNEKMDISYFKQWRKQFHGLISLENINETV